MVPRSAAHTVLTPLKPRLPSLPQRKGAGKQSKHFQYEQKSSGPWQSHQTLEATFSCCGGELSLSHGISLLFVGLLFKQTTQNPIDIINILLLFCLCLLGLCICSYVPVCVCLCVYAHIRVHVCTRACACTCISKCEDQRLPLAVMYCSVPLFKFNSFLSMSLCM